MFDKYFPIENETLDLIAPRDEDEYQDELEMIEASAASAGYSL